MSRWIKLVDQLNLWHEDVKPLEFYEIVRDDKLIFYNRAGARREWSLKDIPGDHALLYTSLAIAFACSTKQLDTILHGEDSRVYWYVMSFLRSVDDSAFNETCKSWFTMQLEADVSRFNRIHVEFVEDINMAFSWALGTYIMKDDADKYINEAKGMLSCEDSRGARQSEEALYPHERQELGFLKVEKSKRDRYIQAAVALTLEITSQFNMTKAAITRNELCTMSSKAGFHDVSDAALGIIWKSLPEEFRHKGGRRKRKTLK